MAQQQHTHHIDIQTDEPLVTVSIGSDGGVPGGFAKLFNRIVDSEGWSRLSDAGRAVYIPMVRFADHRNQFRVKIGHAALMKYSGLSRSSAKRAIKDLLHHRLIVVIERGGVSDAGENESSLYQLLVPAENRPTMSGSAPGVPQRTPTRFTPEPPAGRAADRPGDLLPTDRWANAAHRGGSGGGPQLKTSNKEFNNRVAALEQPDSGQQADAVALLVRSGVNADVARKLAAQFPHERIIDVIATMEWRRARGDCENPGGFICDALTHQWQVPRAVTEARAKANARLRTQAIEQGERAAAARQQSSVAEEESQVQRLIESLDDQDLSVLAESVRNKYRDNAAVTAVLNRKPPRECRLMKMEIAAMLAKTTNPD